MRHVLLFELRRLAVSIVIGVAATVGVLALFVGGAYPIYRDAKAEVEPILASMPPQFAAVFGIGKGVDIFTFAGFYRFSYLYLALVASIAGAAWGLSAFGRERRAKASDFLGVMPVSRSGVFAGKLVACLCGVALMAAVYLPAVPAVAAIADRGGGADGVPTSHLMVAATAIPAVALMFVAIGALLGVAMRRMRSVSAIATTLGLLGFITVSLPELTGEDDWRAIAPFLYFDQDAALKDGRFETGWIVCAAMVTVVCLIASWLVSVRREVRA